MAISTHFLFLLLWVPSPFFHLLDRYASCRQGTDGLFIIIIITVIIFCDTVLYRWVFSIHSAVYIIQIENSGHLHSRLLFIPNRITAIIPHIFPLFLADFLCTFFRSSLPSHGFVVMLTLLPCTSAQHSLEYHLWDGWVVANSSSSVCFGRPLFYLHL